MGKQLFWLALYLLQLPSQSQDLELHSHYKNFIQFLLSSKMWYLENICKKFPLQKFTKFPMFHTFCTHAIFINILLKFLLQKQLKRSKNGLSIQ